MAQLTKAQQAQFDALNEAVRIAKAFRFTEKVEPDVPPPSYTSIGDRLTRGWQFNTYNGTVFKMCSSSSFHGYDWEKTTSQNPRHLYSTRELALRALRAELEQEFAKKLANVDRQIEHEKAIR